MSANITQIQNRIVELTAQIDAIAAAGEVSAEDAVRLAELNGRLGESRDSLMRASVELQAENERILAEAASADPREAAADLASMLFGARDAFTGIEPGWKASVPYAELSRAVRSLRNDYTPGVTGLPTPTYFDADLPAPVAPVINFLETLPKGLTDGHETYFQAPVLTNKAAGWTSGNKPGSALEWSQDTAHIETIAHWMPIAKQTVRRYRQLENTVIGTLLLGLDIAKNRYALTGANESGIIGARNMSGTLSYSVADDDMNIRDIAIEMAMRVRLACGFSPNYVVVSPQALAKAKKAKDHTGRYMYPEIVYDGKIDGMTIVEDVEMHSVEGTGDAAVELDAMGVYFSGACSWNTADPDAVEIGLTDKQFVQNSYTILAEGTHALKMPFPAGFCFCDDISGTAGLDSE